jgi:predicted RNA-binding protein YlqC (UPF0109 family)
MADEKVLAGSEPMNPLVTDTPAAPENSDETPKAPESTDPEKGTQEPESKEDIAAVLEKRLKESQSMIGKQGNNIGALKKELEALRAEIAESRKPPPGPSDDQVLSDLYAKMDAGEIDIATGMQQALAINSKLTANQVMQQFRQEQQRNKVSEIQGQFLQKNPDYQEALESGELQKYLDEDPLADEYAAYLQYKADARVAELEKAAEARVAAAKEEGAKLARGAEASGKVLGKQGASSVPTPKPQGPWKNNQDASAAMLAKLREMRGASTQ